MLSAEPFFPIRFPPFQKAKRNLPSGQSSFSERQVVILSSSIVIPSSSYSSSSSLFCSSLDSHLSIFTSLLHAFFFPLVHFISHAIPLERVQSTTKESIHIKLNSFKFFKFPLDSVHKVVDLSMFTHFLSSLRLLKCQFPSEWPLLPIHFTWIIRLILITFPPFLLLTSPSFFLSSRFPNSWHSNRMGWNPVLLNGRMLISCVSSIVVFISLPFSPSSFTSSLHFSFPKVVTIKRVNSLYFPFCQLFVNIFVIPLNWLWNGDESLYFLCTVTISCEFPVVYFQSSLVSSRFFSSQIYAIRDSAYIIPFIEW